MTWLEEQSYIKILKKLNSNYLLCIMENEKQLLLDNKQEKGKRLDILTKVSPKRKDIREAFGKEIINKDLPLLIRNNFSKSLDKINSLDTKDIGFNELKQTITFYNNQEYLKIYYSLLSVYNKNFSTSAKELQILTIGYLSSVYKESLIDISDKPPNLLKTVSKFIGIINNFMSKVKLIFIKGKEFLYN